MPITSRRSFVLCLLGSLTVLVFGCSSKDVVGKPPATDVVPLSVTEALDATNLGRTVTVKAEVFRVCQDEGCWMTVTDGKSVVRVVFEGGTFYVPTDLSGTVLISGTIREEVFEEKIAKAIRLSMGESESAVAALSGDQRIPIFTATGVQFLSSQP